MRSIWLPVALERPFTRCEWLGRVAATSPCPQDHHGPHSHPRGSAAVSEGSLGFARGAVTAAVDHQVKYKLIEVQQAILDVQAKLGDAQEERLSLLHQVAELKEKVRTSEAAKAAVEGYELCEVAPGRCSTGPRQTRATPRLRRQSRFVEKHRRPSPSIAACLSRRRRRRRGWRRRGRQRTPAFPQVVRPRGWRRRWGRRCCCHLFFPSRVG